MIERRQKRHAGARSKHSDLPDRYHCVRVALMDHKYEVRFVRGEPETPPTKDEPIAIAREAARKLGVPNAESEPLYRVGRNSHTGEVWAYVEWTWEGLR
ncbi:MAG TPA: hypothetical protein VE032_03040 [Actinomycetota bacterium]|nr:hypothetical protein [Actinomycetota bacterium]